MANETQSPTAKRDRINRWLPSGFDPYAPSGTYIPNKLSRSLRFAYAAWALVLMAYGTIGVALDDIFIPGKRGNGIHLHGVSAWIMYAAIVLGATIFVSEIVDHFDTRDNERWYRAYRKVAKAASVTLIAAAFVHTIIPFT